MKVVFFRKKLLSSMKCPPWCPSLQLDRLPGDEVLKRVTGQNRSLGFVKQLLEKKQNFSKKVLRRRS